MFVLDWAAYSWTAHAEFGMLGEKNGGEACWYPFWGLDGSNVEVNYNLNWVVTHTITKKHWFPGRVHRSK